MYIEFCREIIENKNKFVGDILEFGTGGGMSTEFINEFLYDYRDEIKIFTFDGFVGLPKTNKVIPQNTDWREGNFLFKEEDTRKRLEKYVNTIVIKELTFNLKEPSYYGISKISGVNIDVDLYEGTIDALNFADKCEWSNLLIRFDDWGSHPNQIKEEVDEHEKAAFYDFINDKKYKYNFYYNSENKEQTIVEIMR